MRILFANKFWFCSGGVERVMFDEIEWLESAGHSTAHFSTIDDRNVDSPWQEYFIPYTSLSDPAALGPREKVAATLKMFNNRDAARRFAALVDDFQPDVVHVHSIYRQISPSILSVAARRDIPIVQTLHDYHAICPADLLLRSGSRLCDPVACRSFSYWPAILNRCVRGSVSLSSVASAEVAFQHLRGAYTRNVTAFVCPSEFMADKVSGDLWPVPVHVIPNAVSPAQQPVATRGSAEVVAFCGRLVPEKGILVALEAARIGKFRLRVIGDGPLAEDVARHPNADLVGWLGSQALESALMDVAAVTVPSTWYENAPMAVLEPMSLGLPVVASAIGGIPEMIENGIDGLLVTPGSMVELANALRKVIDDRELAARLGCAAREKAAKTYSPAKHVESLMALYALLLGARPTGENVTI